MIIIIKQNVEEAKVSELTNWLQENFDVKVRKDTGAHTTILGLVGDTAHLDVDSIQSHEIVESVKRISEPYKTANRKFHPDDTVIDVSGHKIGAKDFQVIAGPCSVESEEQIIGIAKRAKAAGATMLRGGAFKPRTSPYAFQGLHAEGIEFLLEARKETGLPIVTEIMDVLKTFGVSVLQKDERFHIRGNSTYHRDEYMIEGDYSNAAFFLAAAAISGSNITVSDLSNTSVQGDRAILDLLRQFGIKLHIGKDTVTVQGGNLHAIEIDAQDIPDLVPILAVIASFAQGKTRIFNVSRLRIKESDRLEAIADGLSKMGADIKIENDELIIVGHEKLQGGCTISSYGDHRIAMALSIAATCSENSVKILDAECINKSYPNFYQDFNAIGGKTNVFNVG